ncbi:MAG: protein-disulfide reductase DsbD domain-containing protein [Akkermansiaceae bacterium]
MKNLVVSKSLFRRRTPLPILAVALLLSFVGSHPAFSQTGLKLQLVAEQSAIIPGKPFTVGLWLNHDPGHHTYWRFPGIVGVPTQLKWALPPGWTAGDLIYPEPERVHMFKIKAQGFNRDVMLHTEITPPAGLKTGGTLTLHATAFWMCCGTSCHPGSMDLQLTLPISENAPLNEKWHERLNEERSRAEQPSDAWSTTASVTGATVTLSLKPANANARLCKSQREAKQIIVFTEDGYFDTDKPQIIRLGNDGSLQFDLIISESAASAKTPETLRAILRNEDGWLNDSRLRSLKIAPKILLGK